MAQRQEYQAARVDQDNIRNRVSAQFSGVPAPIPQEQPRLQQQPRVQQRPNSQSVAGGGNYYTSASNRPTCKFHLTTDPRVKGCSLIDNRLTRPIRNNNSQKRACSSSPSSRNFSSSYCCDGTFSGTSSLCWYVISLCSRNLRIYASLEPC